MTEWHSVLLKYFSISVFRLTFTGNHFLGHRMHNYQEVARTQWVDLADICSTDIVMDAL
jgi:hypothetical protein